MVSFRLHTCSTGLPRRIAIPLFTNHNMTACQSTRDHQERTQTPCQRTPSALLFTQSWRESKRIHAFPRDISAVWNATNLSRIWSRVGVSISYDDTMGNPCIYTRVYVSLFIFVYISRRKQIFLNAHTHSLTHAQILKSCSQIRMEYLNVYYTGDSILQILLLKKLWPSRQGL